VSKRLSAIVGILAILESSCSSQDGGPGDWVDVAADMCPSDVESFQVMVHASSDFINGSLRPNNRIPVELVQGNTGLAVFVSGFLTFTAPRGCNILIDHWQYEWIISIPNEILHNGYVDFSKTWHSIVDNEWIIPMNLRLERDYRDIPVHATISIRFRSGSFTTSYAAVPIRLIP
jgi:hypothetical protein